MQIIEHTENYNSNEKEKKKRNLKGTILIIILFMISFLLGAGIMYLIKKDDTKVVTKSRTISQNKVTEEAMEEAIDKIYDAVLCIEVVDSNGNTISSGTGFIYDKDDKYGYVLTNSHVISGGTNIIGLMSNSKTVSLKILGTDSYTDLAVLKMDVKDVISVASIGTSKNTEIGNTVFTVGAPMGADYAGTVTKGILSGKDRLIETQSTSNSSEAYIVKVIQTDAAISPGNSGGPLVNLAGDVIGINSLKLVDTQVEGMGFAIPIEDAMLYVDTLEKGETIKRPVIGVQIIDMTNSYLLNRYNINTDGKVSEGIVLINVNDDYPASDAGLKSGDIITKIDDEKVKTTAEFKYRLYKHNINDSIKVTYYRNGKEEEATLKLDKFN